MDSTASTAADEAYLSPRANTVNGPARAVVTASTGNVRTLTQMAFCQYRSRSSWWDSRAYSRDADGANSVVKLNSTPRFSAAIGNTARKSATCCAPPNEPTTTASRSNGSSTYRRRNTAHGEENTANMSTMSMSRAWIGASAIISTSSAAADWEGANWVSGPLSRYVPATTIVPIPATTTTSNAIMPSSRGRSARSSYMARKRALARSRPSGTTACTSSTPASAHAYAP